MFDKLIIDLLTCNNCDDNGQNKDRYTGDN